MRYHHVGIPTTVTRSGETYLEEYKMFVSGFDASPFGVEWLRFEPGCPLPDLVRSVPHVAFVVDDLDAATAGREILIQPNRPSEGVTVAFVIDNGAPVEFLKFDGPEFEVWPGREHPEETGRLECRFSALGPGETCSQGDGDGVLAVFARIRRAMLENDIAVLDALIAPDYEGCGADGRVNNRSLVLSAFGAGGVSLGTYDVSELRATALGGTTLVSGVAFMEGSYAGARFEHRARFLDVYTHRHGAWTLVASQTTDMK